MSFFWQNPSGSLLRNPREPAGEHEATELRIYIDNDRRFSPQSPEGQGRSIALNLLRKMKKGTYNHRLAPQGWMPVVDGAAKAYSKEFGSGERGEWSQIFNPATRRLVAQALADDFQQNVRTGEYKHLQESI